MMCTFFHNIFLKMIKIIDQTNDVEFELGQKDLLNILNFINNQYRKVSSDYERNQVNTFADKLFMVWELKEKQLQIQNDQVQQKRESLGLAEAQLNSLKNNRGRSPANNKNFINQEANSWLLDESVRRQAVLKRKYDGLLDRYKKIEAELNVFKTHLEIANQREKNQMKWRQKCSQLQKENQKLQKLVAQLQEKLSKVEEENLMNLRDLKRIKEYQTRQLELLKQQMEKQIKKYKQQLKNLQKSAQEQLQFMRSQFQEREREWHVKNKGLIQELQGISGFPMKQDEGLDEWYKDYRRIGAKQRQKKRMNSTFDTFQNDQKKIIEAHRRALR